MKYPVRDEVSLKIKSSQTLFLMTQAEKISAFQQAIEAVEALSLDEQAMLVDIILNRLKQQRRTHILEEVAQAEREYDHGNVRRGSVVDLMAELDD